MKILTKAVYLLACSIATATASVALTIGLLPIPKNPIISTWAGTEDDPANWANTVYPTHGIRHTIWLTGSHIVRMQCSSRAPTEATEKYFSFTALHSFCTFLLRGDSIALGWLNFPL